MKLKQLYEKKRAAVKSTLTPAEYAALKKGYLAGDVRQSRGYPAMQEKMVTTDPKLWNIFRGIDSTKELLKIPTFTNMAKPMLARAEKLLMAMLDDRIAGTADV